MPSRMVVVLALSSLAACSPRPPGGVEVHPGRADAGVITVYESQACSTNPADDPLLVCSQAFELVCISTYGVVVTNPAEREKGDGGVRSVFVCREPCASDADCRFEGDLCCPGTLGSGGTARACVPRAMCDAARAGAPG